MSMLEHYHCPKCGKKYLGLSPKPYFFVCAFCNTRWMIQEVTKYTDEKMRLKSKLKEPNVRGQK